MPFHIIVHDCDPEIDNDSNLLHILAHFKDVSDTNPEDLLDFTDMVSTALDNPICNEVYKLLDQDGVEITQPDLLQVTTWPLRQVKIDPTLSAQAAEYTLRIENDSGKELDIKIVTSLCDQLFTTSDYTIGDIPAELKFKMGSGEETISFDTVFASKITGLNGCPPTQIRLN